MIFISIINICLQLWIRYGRVNKNTVEGYKLVDTYLAIEAMKKRRIK